MTGVAARRRAVVTAGAGLAIVAATLGLILFDQPEVRALRGVDDTVTIPATTRLARGANTLTTTATVPPTTTTTVAPTTTVPPPVTAPPPPAPTEGLWDTYRRCTRGNHADLTVIPGGTSWTKADSGGYVWLEVSQWHLDAGGWVLCWTLAHEDGHLHALVTWPGSAGTPPGWPYGPERYADCYAQLLVGGQRGTCPNLELAKGLM